MKKEIQVTAGKKLSKKKRKRAERKVRKTCHKLDKVWLMYDRTVFTKFGSPCELSLRNVTLRRIIQFLR